MNIFTIKKAVFTLTLVGSTVLFANMVSAAQTPTPLASQFTVTNVKAADGDSIKVTDVVSGVVLKAYNAADGALLGTTTASGTTAEISGLNLTAGTDTVQVSLTTGTATTVVVVPITDPLPLGLTPSNTEINDTSAPTESDKIFITVGTEPYDDVTVKWNPNDLVITNNVGKPDTLTLSNLEVGNIVKVYDAADPAARKILGQATVLKGKTEATVTLKELGGIGSTDGKVFITVTKEPVAAQVIILGAPRSKPPTDIIATNNYLTPGTVKVSNLLEGDIVNIYRNDGTTLVGKATVAKGKTDATFTSKKDSINVAGETLKLTVTSTGKRASNFTTLVVSEAAASVKLLDASLTVTNNYLSANTLKVTSLLEGDIVNVYREDGTTLIVKTTALPKTKTEVVIPLKKDVINEAGETFKITVTSLNKKPSDFATLVISAAATSDKLLESDVTATNQSAKLPDKVKVTGLISGDTVKITGTDITPISGKVLTSKTEIEFTVKGFKAEGGTFDITVTKVGKKESLPLTFTYDPDTGAVSTALTDADVTVNHIADEADSVVVSNIHTGDVIEISKDSVVIGTATADGNTITIPLTTDLGSAAGTLNITVKTPAKKISPVFTKSYDIESIRTAAILLANVTITMNTAENGHDFVVITGLTPSDYVTLYFLDGNGFHTSRTVDNGGTVGFDLYMSVGMDLSIVVKSPGKLESKPLLTTTPFN